MSHPAPAGHHGQPAGSGPVHRRDQRDHAREIGENDCADTYIGPLMNWLDARSSSYLARAWNTDFACTTGPGLITSYTGTPTGYGQGYRGHLQKLG
jgi:endoglucanase